MKFTYANVTSTLALFLALCGVSYAAGAIPVNGVGSAQLQAKSVTGDKIADQAIGAQQLKVGAVQAANLASNSVTAPKIAGSSVGLAKLAADAKAAGPAFDSANEVMVSSPATVGSAIASCPDGHPNLVTGGAELTSGRIGTGYTLPWSMRESRPFDLGERAKGGRNIVWYAASSDVNQYIVAWALCHV